MTSPLEAEFAMHVRGIGMPVPEREYRFHPKRKWRFDFAWLPQKVAVELEGGTWSGGRHVRGSGFEGDCEKYAEAVKLGWKVLRFTGAHVKSGYALDTTERVLEAACEN